MSGPASPSRRGFVWAIGASALLHLVLFLSSSWLITPAARPPEERTVTFRFDTPPPEPLVLDPPEVEPPPVEPPPPSPPPVPEPAVQVPQQESLLRPEPAPGAGPLTEKPGTPPEGTELDPRPPEDSRAEERETERRALAADDDVREAPPDARRLDLARALREYEDVLRDEPPPAIDAAPSREPAPGGDSRPGLPSLPSGTFGMGNLVFESGDYDWTDYARQVLVILERAVNHRIWVTMDDFERWAHENRNYLIGPEQRVRARFVIERSGEIVDISIEGPSGVIPLDAAVQDSLEEAILPRLPGGFPRDREVVHIEGYFPHGAQILQLRPAYRRWKAMGLF
jgi:hypothetical protein